MASSEERYWTDLFQPAIEIFVIPAMSPRVKSELTSFLNYSGRSHRRMKPSLIVAQGTSNGQLFQWAYGRLVSSLYSSRTRRAGLPSTLTAKGDGNDGSGTVIVGVIKSV